MKFSYSFFFLSLALALGLAPPSAFPAGSKRTWGKELTFTRPNVEAADHGSEGLWAEAPENKAALREFYDHAKLKLKGRGDIKSIRYLTEFDRWGIDIIRVKYASGFFFDVTLDPYCLEVRPQYSTLDVLKEEQKALIRTDIYGLMHDIGMKPKRDIGGGHLHMGAEVAFGKNVRLARNWLVYQANHFEVALGAMEYDDDNACSFFKMNRSQKEEFARVIQEVDRGKIKTPRKLFTEFVARVLFEGKPATGNLIMEHKYWQVNVLRMAELDTESTLANPNSSWKNYEAFVLFDSDNVSKKERTAEYRYIKAQVSEEELVDDVTLHDGIMDYLEGLTLPLALSDEFMSNESPPIPKMVKNFYDMIRDSKSDPAKYLSRLPQKEDGNPDWQIWQTEFKKLLGCSAVLAGTGKPIRKKRID